MDLSIDGFTLLVVFVSLVISISIHEMMHAFVGLKLGDTTAQEEGRISLNPLRHIDPFLTLVLPAITLLLFHAPILAAKPVPFNPDRVKYDEFGAALIAVAGPLTNFGLAVVAALVLRYASLDATMTSVWLIFLQLNVGLFVFNMVPIPPLDGSRLLYAVAPEPVQAFMAQLEQFGFFIIFGLILLVPGFTDLLLSIDNAIIQFLLQTV